MGLADTSPIVIMIDTGASSFTTNTDAVRDVSVNTILGSISPTETFK